MDLFYNVPPTEFKEFEDTAKSFVRRDWERMNKEQVGEGTRGNNKERMKIIKGLLHKLRDQQTFFIKFDAAKGKGVRIDSLD
jgi:hypothetical protein